ncbi:hypothetical protein WH5701_08679 [Synechococcus sp. WH 5701]|nr:MULTISPECIES: hypothetical protein [unclassified Synechococcus]EAQ75144.1 hypothetical protein WH5701_08679 [Synechococcus sp. WH 5701]WFN57750.1 hypothetical protein N4320_07690 [Synechococcus sp. CCFWC 502]
MEALRTRDGRTGLAMAAYLDLVGNRLLDGFDITNPRALELPDVLLRGLAASPGVYEGPVRRVSLPPEFDRIQKGDVLVTDRGGLLSTLRSWRGNTESLGWWEPARPAGAPGIRPLRNVRGRGGRRQFCRPAPDPPQCALGGRAGGGPVRDLVVGEFLIAQITLLFKERDFEAGEMLRVARADSR